jgi:hypothetical protein
MSEEQVGGDAADTDTYALKSAELPEIAAPQVPYRPPRPKSYRPKIGMIGTGGISASHLDAYRTAGWDVVVGKAPAAQRSPATRPISAHRCRCRLHLRSSD